MSQQAHEQETQQDRKVINPPVHKYTTHLRPETIKAIKRTAVERDRKDYEIVQAALNAYLAMEDLSV